MGSTRARKSRKALYQASLHTKKGFVHAGLSDELAKKLGTQKRSVAVRKGDTVRVLCGSKKGHTGKVMSVGLAYSVVYVEGVTQRNSKGIEKPSPLPSSKLQITDGEFSGWRKKILERR